MSRRYLRSSSQSVKPGAISTREVTRYQAWLPNPDSFSFLLTKVAFYFGQRTLKTRRPRSR